MRNLLFSLVLFFLLPCAVLAENSEEHSEGSLRQEVAEVKRILEGFLAQFQKTLERAEQARAAAEVTKYEKLVDQFSRGLKVVEHLMAENARLLAENARLLADTKASGQKKDLVKRSVRSSSQLEEYLVNTRWSWNRSLEFVFWKDFATISDQREKYSWEAISGRTVVYSDSQGRKSRMTFTDDLRFMLIVFDNNDYSVASLKD